MRSIEHNASKKDRALLYFNASNLFLTKDERWKCDYLAKVFNIAAKRYIYELHLLFVSTRNTFGSTCAERSFDDFLITKILLSIVSKTFVDTLFYNRMNISA